jgi:hypothetical protein
MRGESGQSTVEWVGLVLAAALVLGAVAASVGARVPGGSLARAIAGVIVCAMRLSDACGSRSEDELVAAYGDEVAALVDDHAPRIRYERGMRALPVDYRRCREDACSTGAPTGQVWRSTTGEPVVAFVHVVDCRALAVRRAERRGGECSGGRAGNLYLQYWFNCKRRIGAFAPVASLCVRAGRTSRRRDAS